MGIKMEATATADEFVSGSTKPASRAPRLFIKEMVMRNFKSYAGEQRVGPFHKSFSAVVGPNGSGKSNVIDAMLFVFGKRAKQDDEGYEVVLRSDFVITLIAFRDNSSKITSMTEHVISRRSQSCREGKVLTWTITGF